MGYVAQLDEEMPAGPRILLLLVPAGFTGSRRQSLGRPGLSRSRFSSYRLFVSMASHVTGARL